MVYGKYWNSKKHHTFMSEPNNPEKPKQRGWSSWSVIRKAQIIMAAISALTTIVILTLCEVINPGYHNDLERVLGDAGLYVMLPAALFVGLFGVAPHWFDLRGGAAVFPLCVIILINSLLGFLCGTLIGLLQACSVKKK
jgi:hypothetical protein